MQVQGDGPPKRGKIRWISKRRGFGFIAPESGGDLYFHSSEAISSFDELRLGDPVRFGVEQRRAGPAAIRVMKDTSLALERGGAPSPPRRERSLPLGDHLFLLDLNGVFHYVPSTPGPAGNILVQSEELASVVTDAALLSAPTGTPRIARICSQFEQLINDPSAHERVFQEFFEEYPDFLLADQYEALYPQVVLPMDANSGELRPDFILRPFAGMTHEPEIVELKLPHQPIVKLNRSHVSLYSPIYDAVAQLRSYARVFADEGNRETLAEQLGFTAYRPSLALIVGRAANMPSQRLAALAREGIAPVQLRTYDDLLLRYRQRARL